MEKLTTIKDDPFDARLLAQIVQGLSCRKEAVSREVHGPTHGAAPAVGPACVYQQEVSLLPVGGLLGQEQLEDVLWLDPGCD